MPLYHYGGDLTRSLKAQNFVRNSAMLGAVAGAVGSGGVFPTNWVRTADTGLVATVIGTGSESGIEYVEIRFAGTTNSTSLNLFFDAFNIANASVGQVWTSSCYAAITGGDTTNVTTLSVRAWEYTSGAVAVGVSTTSILAASSTLTRFSVTRTFDQVNTAFARASITFGFSSGVAVDITLRIGAPQLVFGASSLPIIRTPPLSI